MFLLAGSRAGGGAAQRSAGCSMEMDKEGARGTLGRQSSQVMGHGCWGWAGSGGAWVISGSRALRRRWLLPALMRAGRLC